VPVPICTTLATPLRSLQHLPSRCARRTGHSHTATPMSLSDVVPTLTGSGACVSWKESSCTDGR